MRRFFVIVCLLPVLAVPAGAKTISWVDFDVPYESLRYAMERDIATAEQEVHMPWVRTLAVAACRTGGKCPLASVKRAAEELKGGKSPEEIVGELSKYYAYYYEAYDAVLGGLLGSYAIEKDGQWISKYGLKAFSPIAAGYGYSHCDDFGVNRSFGFRRKHLGHDMMGGLGTPIVAVEGGVVEALGWNRYGGWRIGIRSFDSKRYYYYAHLQKESPSLPAWSKAILSRPATSLGIWAAPGIPTRKIPTISKPSTCTSVFSWFSTKARKSATAKSG